MLPLFLRQLAMLLWCGSRILITARLEPSQEYQTQQAIHTLDAELHNTIDLGGGYYGIIDIWIAHNITGHATNAVKATFSGAADAASRIIALEFSGMHLTAAHDTGYAPAYNLDDTSPHTTTAANTAEDGEMVVGFFWDVYDPTASVGAYSSSSPSVVRINAVIGGSIASATNLVGAAGSYSVAVSATNTEHHWCYAKAFKQAAAAANVKLLLLNNTLGGDASRIISMG